MKYSSVCATIRQYLKSNEYPKNKGHQVPSRIILEKEHSLFLVQEIYLNPSISCERLAQKLNSQFSTNVHRTTVSRFLKSGIKRHGIPEFTLKKIVVDKEKRWDDNLLDKRISFVEKYCQFVKSGLPVLWTDESGYNVIRYRIQGRSPKGTSCVFPYQSRPFFRNITAISTLRSDAKIINIEFFEGSVTGDIIEGYFRNMISKALITESTLFILDNADIHHKNKNQVSHWLQNLGHYVLFLPPYSPEFNPIEHIFHFWKSNVETISDCKSRIELTMKLSNAFFDIEVSHIRSSILEAINVMFDRALNRQHLTPPKPKFQIPTITDISNSPETTSEFFQEPFVKQITYHESKKRKRDYQTDENNPIKKKKENWRGKGLKFFGMKKKMASWNCSKI